MVRKVAVMSVSFLVWVRIEGSELVLEVEDLLQLEEAGVWGGAAEVFEQVAHLGLPERVDLPRLHAGHGSVEVIGLEVPDEETVLPQEERVVAPAVLLQRVQHLRPHCR